MVKILELREMIRLVSKSSIQEFEMKNNGIKISMKKPLPKVIERDISQETIHEAFHEAAASLTDTKQETKALIPELTLNESQLYEIVSPFIGVYSSCNLQVGNKISIGTLVGTCNVEVLGLNHEILSDVEGEIVEVLVEEGQLLEYSQPLFVVKPISGGTQ